MLEHLEGENSAVNVASVDFSKAFNRVDHMSCLQSLADLGASNQSLEIICRVFREVLSLCPFLS